MTTTEPTPRQVAVKVSPEDDRLITSGAHYLRMSKLGQAVPPADTPPDRRPAKR